VNGYGETVGALEFARVKPFVPTYFISEALAVSAKKAISEI